MVVSLAVSAILGGCNPPLDASKLSKRADAINHYTPQNLTHPLIFLKGNSLSYKLLITDSSKYVTKTTKLAKLSFVPATTTACSQDSYVYNKNSIRSCHHTNFMKKYSKLSRNCELIYPSQEEVTWQLCRAARAMNFFQKLSNRIIVARLKSDVSRDNRGGVDRCLGWE